MQNVRSSTYVGGFTSPCDFDLIPKIKEPLRGIRFRTVPEILKSKSQGLKPL